MQNDIKAIAKETLAKLPYMKQGFYYLVESNFTAGKREYYIIDRNKRAEKLNLESMESSEETALVVELTSPLFEMNYQIGDIAPSRDILAIHGKINMK